MRGSKTTKFAVLFEVRKQMSEEEAAETSPDEWKGSHSVSKFKALFDSLPVSRTKGKKGRPAAHARGKRSDPDYTQITACVRKANLHDLKAKLQKEGKDMSDIVQAAFDEYLST